MRIFKWLKNARFLIVFLIFNMFMSFLLEPAKGASEKMWGGYYKEEELDTIFVGSSVSSMTFNPYIFDEQLGVKSYNMGTPSQAMPQTVRAIEVAIEEHDINTVIFGMGFSTLKYDPIGEAELTFESARARKKGGLGGIINALSYMYSEDVRTEEKSINYLFPWLYNREEMSTGGIIENVTLKVQNIKEELSSGQTDTNQASSKGYANGDTSTFDYEKKWEVNTYRKYGADFNEDMLAEFEVLLQLCNENDVDLIIVNTPHPSFDVVACYESYENNQEQLKALCQKYGAEYYDFSLAKPEIFDAKEEYFGDFEHLNYEGSQIFDQYFCDFLNRRANGEDMNAYFYSVDEFLEVHSDELEEWKNILEE